MLLSCFGFNGVVNGVVFWPSLCMAEILCRTTYYIIVRVSVVLAGFLYMGPFLYYHYHVMDVVLVYIG